ncbi:uncharacterized protein NPIL_446771 [Nephila pilipes]|uniref:Ionotropic glutamate receptor L-glutamate and glycine-binding domain-containing protein n=1 Tax=Nephila pilipes TaxID=299642 RepID=A0A8X6QQH6_NEPPI|nr:uncharacterized protein NPIL_446771 [Nephila pilipes]
MDCPSVLKIATVESPFLMEIVQNKIGGIKLMGIEGKVLQIFLEILNIPFELVIAEDSEWGRSLSNGSWTGMIGKVHKGEADIAINTLAMNEERLKVIDFSNSYAVDEITFGVLKPGAYPNSLVFIYPFDINVWIAIIFVLFLAPLLFRFLMNAANSYTEIMFQLWALVLRQSANFNCDTYRNVILFLSWTFFATIVSFGYSANISSFLMVPLEMPIPRDFKELSEVVKSGSVGCIAPKGSFAIHFLATSDKEYLRNLAQTITRNEWYISDESSAGDAAIMTDRNLLKLKAGQEEWKNYYMSDDSVLTFITGIVMKKNFCYKEKLNKIISRFSSAGLYEKIVQDESFRLFIRDSKNIHKTLAEIPLSLTDFSSAFIILSVGLSLAMVSFIFEIIYHNRCVKS